MDKDGVSSSNSSSNGNSSSSSRGDKGTKAGQTQSQKGRVPKSPSLIAQVFGNQLPIVAFVSALTYAAYKGMVQGQGSPERVLMAPSFMAVVLMVSFFGWRMMAELKKR
ncbi:MAG: hypothetical protein WDW36_009986 [Sanguina aurantia]